MADLKERAVLYGYDGGWGETAGGGNPGVVGGGDLGYGGCLRWEWG